MKNTVVYRLMAAVLAAAAVFALLCGCGKDKTETDAGQQITAEQSVPDIFIEEDAALGNQENPPALMLETTTGETVAATAATLGGYVWEWMDSDGRKQLSEKEAPCAADMKEITVIERSETDGKTVLQITGGDLRSVQMWVDSAPMEEGERLTVENNTIFFPAEGAYRYEIVVEYAGGRVYYAFMVR